MILDGGVRSIESTIVDTTAPPPQLPILRLEDAASRAQRSGVSAELSYAHHGRAPSTLKNHYAPRLPLYLFEPRSSHQVPRIAVSHEP